MYCQRLLAVDIDFIELYPDSPPDVCKYRKLMSNKFGDSQDVNVVECLDECPEVRAHWDSFRDENRITASRCATRGEFTYAKQHEKLC